MNPEREQKLTKARFLLSEIDSNRKALRALEIHPIDLENITAIERLEAKLADGISLDEGEELMLGNARENLAGTYRKVSYPIGVKPLPPFTRAQYQARAEREGIENLDNWAEAWGLNALNEVLKAEGKPAVSFELIHMQPPKKSGLVKLGFFATIREAIRLWFAARKARKQELAKYKMLAESFFAKTDTDEDEE